LDGPLAGALALIREYTRIERPPLAPELRLHLADRLVPLWQATEWRAAGPVAPPFWAFAWPGSQALARYLLDTPSSVRGRRVLDFGSGSGLAAIAAAHAGASDVVACDIDPLAAVVQTINARLNGVHLTTLTTDPVGTEVDAELILVGDVCYEREASERIIPWLRELAARGAEVLLADPGRSYAPSEHLQLVETYDVATLRELESVDTKRTRLWRLLPG
jgi:predicted nicotinamide N-methyase